MPVNIRIEETPNPSARRYILDKKIQDDPKGRFFTAAESGDEPLVKELLDIASVEGVMLLPNSITINKGGDGDWSQIEEKALATIEAHLA